MAVEKSVTASVGTMVIGAHEWVRNAGSSDVYFFKVRSGDKGDTGTTGNAATLKAAADLKLASGEAITDIPGEWAVVCETGGSATLDRGVGRPASPFGLNTPGGGVGLDASGNIVLGDNKAIELGTPDLLGPGAELSMYSNGVDAMLDLGEGCLSVNQGADDEGIQLRGYDDRSGVGIDMYDSGSGAVSLRSVGANLNIQAANGRTLYLDSSNGTVAVGILTAGGEVSIAHASGKLGFYGATRITRPSALTAADSGTINSGDATTDGVIDNNRTRIGELETKLQALGLIQ
jgi:hypothetical protein